MKLCNAFSLSMLPTVADGEFRTLSVRRMALPDVVRTLHPDYGCGVESYVGHADTAALLSKMLGFPVECHREALTIRDGEVMIVAQYAGPRLPEGSTQLPDGASITWFAVEVRATAAERVAADAAWEAHQRRQAEELAASAFATHHHEHIPGSYKGGATS